MPPLLELQDGVVAIHRCFVYAFDRDSASDAWTFAYRAGDVNYRPFNHYGCIMFIRMNSEFVYQCADLARAAIKKVKEDAVGADLELAFLRQWGLAYSITRRVGNLDSQAPYWRLMRVEFGEWAGLT